MTSTTVDTYMVASDHYEPVNPLNGSAVVKVLTGSTVYYNDKPYVTSTSNLGSLTVSQSHTFTHPAWLLSASLSSVSVTLTGAADDATVDSSGDILLSELPAAVPLTSAANAFTKAQTITTTTAGAVPLALDNTAGATPNVKALNVTSSGGAVNLIQQTQWSANLTGNTTYDTLDVYHKSAGDGVFVVHSGGVAQAFLNTGVVASNNAITYVQNSSLSGTAANAVTIRHVVAGLGTTLSVTVSASAVTVNVATDGAGVATSTAAQVIAAVNASATAYALLSAYNTTDSTGTSTGAGVVAAFAATNLAGGFTGTSPGGDAALNSYLPFWQDDSGSGTGVVVGQVMGRKALLVQHNGFMDPTGVGLTIGHAAGGPALNISNQDATAFGAPQVSGVGPAVYISDKSTVSSLRIVRSAAPAVSNTASPYATAGAVIDLATSLTSTYPAIRSGRGDTAGFQLNTDGSGMLGTTGNPTGLLELHKDSGGGTNVLLLNLNNPNTTAAAAGSIQFSTGGNATAVIQSTANNTNTAPLSISVRSGGALVQAVVIFGNLLNLVDGLNLGTGTTTGMKIGTAGGASGQKLGFFNATPVVQPLLATGATHSVDDVITALQSLGLVRQS